LKTKIHHDLTKPDADWIPAASKTAVTIMDSSFVKFSFLPTGANPGETRDVTVRLVLLKYLNPESQRLAYFGVGHEIDNTEQELGGDVYHVAKASRGEQGKDDWHIVHLGQTDFHVLITTP
jgi:hypothetical protein